MSSEPPKLLFSAREAAKALGVCQKTLWALSRPRGDLPVVKMGWRTFYDPRDLQAMIDARKGDMPCDTRPRKKKATSTTEQGAGDVQ